MRNVIPLFSLVAGLAFAQAHAETPLVQASVLPGWKTESRTQMSGLRLQLADGWKTYWRAPGDAGIPPRFDWSGSDNVRSVQVIWPTPHVFTRDGLTSIGYSGDVVLPLEITPKDPSRPMRLRASVDLGVCRDICVPAMLRLDAVVEGPGAPDTAIRAALGDQPVSGRRAGVVAHRCKVEPLRDGLRVTAEIEMPSAGGNETVVFEPGDPSVWVDEASVTRDGEMLVAVTEMVGPSSAPFALDRGDIRITVLGQARAVDIRGCPAS